MVVGGLLLAAGFGGVALRSFADTDPMSEAEARRFVEYWMSRLEVTDLATGLFLTMPPSRRPPPGTDLLAYIRARPELRHSLENFYEAEVVRLLRLGMEPRYTHEKTVAWNPRGRKATFWYLVEYTDSDAKRRRARVEVLLQYELGGPGEASGWWVEKVTLPLGIEFIDGDD